MGISHSRRFEFDVRGFVHLRDAMASEEVEQYKMWAHEAESIDVNALFAGAPDLDRLISRPVSRIIDADPRFAAFLDHPAAVDYLCEFLGSDYKHIDNELYYTHPGYVGGPWHRGVRAHPTGHVVDGRFICPMVKAFYCLTDVGPDHGALAFVPGSHRAQFDFDGGAADRGDDPLHRTADGHVDLPGQHVFDDVHARDIIIFNEALLHAGRPNPSTRTRKSVIVNFGREDAGPWPGYAPASETLLRVTARQAAIMSNRLPVWVEPDLDSFDH